MSKSAATKKTTAKKAAKRAPGRPSKKTQALVDEICERLSRGEPMTVICRHGEMPDPATVWRWAKADPEVSQAIAHARTLGFDAIAEETLAIADDKEGDVQRDRLRVETRLKLLAKWDPKRYGELLKQELSGPNGGAIPVATVDPSKLSDATLQELIRARTQPDAG